MLLRTEEVDKIQVSIQVQNPQSVQIYVKIVSGKSKKIAIYIYISLLIGYGMC